MPQAYALNSARVTTREYLFGTSALLLPVIWILKLLRIRMPGSTDDPAVDSLSSFVVDVSELPAEIRAAFDADLDFLDRAGFDLAVFHRIALPHVATTIHRATLADGSGTVARLQHRYWAAQGKTQQNVQFETEFRDGSRVITFAGTPDMLAPETWDISRRKPCPIDELLEQHRERLQTAFGGERKTIRDETDLLNYVEHQHAELVEFHVARGVFEPGPEIALLESGRTDLEQRVAEASDVDAMPTTMDVGMDDAAVLEELDRLSRNKVSMASVGWGLALSLVAFAAVFAVRQDLRMLWMLIPILLVHEGGHWAAMNAFGYKNMRMFFIPFFGAAVSGRNLNVSGWKKATVALMGPVPSILASIATAVLGIRFELSWLLELSLLSLVVNVFNLLPILPLDGGQTLQAVLFCRSRFLDVLARVVAVGALFTIAAALGAWLLMLLAVSMAIAIPVAYRLAKLTEELRDEGELQTRSPDGTTVPRETALAIIGRLRSGTKTQLAPKILAQQTQSVFENLNARPPGVLATIGLMTVYAGSVLIGLVGIGVVALAQSGDFNRLVDMAAHSPQVPVACDETARTPAVAAAPLADRTLMIHAAEGAEARVDFEELSKRIPGSEVVLVGSTLFFTAPQAAADQIDPLFNELEQSGRRVSAVRRDEPISLSMLATASKERAAFIESELSAFATCPAWLKPLPPWSDAWTASPDLARWRQMRIVLQRCLEEAAAGTPANQAALWKERDEAMRRRDEKRIAEIDAEMSRERQAAIQAGTKRLVGEYGDADSQRVIAATVPYLLEMYGDPTVEDAPDAEEAAEGNGLATPGQRSLFAIRELLGVEPGDEVAPPEDLAVRPYAWADAEGVLLDLNITVPRPGGELTDFVGWLCEQGCTGIRYDIWGLTSDFDAGELFQQ